MKAPPRFAFFLQRLKVLDVVVFHPLLLEIMGRAGSDDADRDLCVEALESYLVRRLVCGMQTRGYGALALNLLKAVKTLPVGAPRCARNNRDIGRSIRWCRSLAG